MISFLLRAPFCLARLTRYLRRSRVRAISIHYPSLSAITVLLASRAARRDIKVGLSFHGSDLAMLRTAGRMERALWRLVIAHSDAVIACSRSLGTDIERTFPGVAAKLKIIHNGIDAAECRRLAASANLPATLRGRPYVATVGTFEEKKGHDALIRGFRFLALEFPDIALVLVGRSGPVLAHVEALLEENGLENRAFVCPDLPHPETLAVIAGAKVFVLPSRIEPFGIVLLEAACLGTPVVATRTGGIPEIIEDQRLGLLVPPDSPPDLSRAIAKLLRETDLAAAFATNLRSVVETTFSWREAATGYAAALACPLSDQFSDVY